MQQESQQCKHGSPNKQLQGVNRQMYDQLKQQVQHMKLDQHELHATKAKQKEAEERRALQHKQEALVTDVEEWSQGEVEAVKAAAAACVQQAEQSAGQWKVRHQEVAADLELLTQSLVEAQQQLQEAKMHLDAQGQQADVAMQQAAATTIQLQQQLEAAKHKLQHKQRFWAQEVQRVEQHWQQQLQVAMREQDAKVCQIQAQHALQLDAVHVKLQGVLTKKDASIAALGAELDATLMQLQHVGDTLFGE
ncbi:hypothetical protein COO60DRAFT_1139263 [Scenedesmus sp. NREL 46B-D3]|nr:hypothetical protein COO60DRAFT_1139263 [Scenedesmus sp. NREL 46B-D3]